MKKKVFIFNYAIELMLHPTPIIKLCHLKTIYFYLLYNHRDPEIPVLLNTVYSTTHFSSLCRLKASVLLSSSMMRLGAWPCMEPYCRWIWWPWLCACPWLWCFPLPWSPWWRLARDVRCEGSRGPWWGGWPWRWPWGGGNFGWEKVLREEGEEQELSIPP